MKKVKTRAPRVGESNRATLEDIEVRSINEDERSAEFVATTEAPVPTWLGPETMRMAGADLKRYKKNPVVIDTHNRLSIRSVVGRAEAKVEGRQLIAKIFFATTDLANDAWDLVKGGFVKALSIAWTNLKVLELKEDETDGEGEHKVTGPAIVILKWSLFEISVVPVPADEDALAREYMEIQGISFNREKEQEPMEDNETRDLDGQEPEGGNDTPADQVPDPSKATASVSLVAEEKLSELIEQSARNKEICDLTPPGRDYEQIRDELIAKGATVETARVKMLEAVTAKSQPVGTPEPTQPSTEDPNKLTMKTVDQAALLRGLGG